MRNVKRTLALLLTLCMVIPMCLVPVVSAEAGTVTPIKFEIPAADGSVATANIFKSLSNSATGEFREWYSDANKTLAEAAYATTNFLPVAFNGKGTTAISFNNATATDLPARMGHNGLLGDWFAFKIKVPNAGTYELSVSEYVRNLNFNNFTLDVYVVDGATATDQTTLTGLFGTSTTTGTATPIGSVTFAPTATTAMLTENVLGADGNNASFTVNNASNECLVVLKVAAMKSTQARMDLTGITLTEIEVEEPEVPDTAKPVDYNMYNPNITSGRYVNLTNVKASYATYIEGTTNLLPFAFYTSGTSYPAYNYNASVASSYAGTFSGMKWITAYEGDFVAVMIKNPGAVGNYKVTVDALQLPVGAQEVSVYCLPADFVDLSSIDSMTIAAQYTTLMETFNETIAASLNNSNLLGTFDLNDGNDYTPISVDLAEMMNVSSTDQDYVLVFKATEENGTDKATVEHQASMMIANVTLTPFVVDSYASVEDVYDFYDSSLDASIEELVANGSVVVNKGAIDLNTYPAFYEKMEAAFSNGSLSLLPLVLDEENVGSPYANTDNLTYNTTAYAYSGIKANTLKGQFLAFKMKNPGDGDFTITISAIGSKNAPKKCDIYIFPASEYTGENTIASLMVEDNYCGYVDLTSTTNYVPVTSTSNGSFAAKASDGEYILVLNATEAYSASGSYGYMWVDDLILNCEAKTADAAVNAINNAGKGDTVTLKWDVKSSAANVVLKAGATLDLNGYDLHVGSFDGIVGQVVDNGSERGTLTSDSGADFNPKNAQIVLKSGEGAYGFYQVEGVALGTKPSDVNCAYWFRLNFADKSAYSLLKNAGNELSATFNVYIDDVALEGTYEFSADTINSYIDYECASAAGQTAGMYLLVKNLDVAMDQDVKVVLTYTIGDNVLSALELAYTYTA